MNEYLWLMYPLFPCLLLLLFWHLCWNSIFPLYFLKFIFNFMFVHILLTGTSLSTCLVSSEVRKWCEISWTWSYRYLWVTMGVLGNKPGFSGRADGALNYWSVLSVSFLLSCFLFVCNVMSYLWHFVIRWHWHCLKPCWKPLVCVLFIKSL